jgi:hypothetical protein
MLHGEMHSYPLAVAYAAALFFPSAISASSAQA